MIYTVLAILLIIMAIPFIALKTKLFTIKNPKAFIYSNIAIFFAVSLLLTGFMFNAPVAAETAQTTAAAADGLSSGLGYLAAALCTGLACLGAGIAVAAGSSAAIGATSENPQMLSKGLIFVALGEGIVLYGLLISFQIINKIG